jgi:hypothetical protein
MRQLSYAIQDIKKHKLGIILFLLQCEIAFLLLSFALGQILSLNAGIGRIKTIRDKGAYIRIDQTPPEKIQSISENKNIARFFDFANRQIDEQYQTYSYLSYQTEGIRIEKRFVSNGVLELFGVHVSAGRSFHSADFQWNGKDPLPVIVGDHLKEVYQLNHTYDFYHNTDIPFQGMVVGVLGKGESYQNIYSIEKSKPLDDSCIFPISQAFIDSYFTFPDYDMAFASTIFVPKDPKDLDAIAAKSEEFNLFSLEFVSVEDHISEYLNYRAPDIYMSLFMALIILLFSCVGMTAHFMSMIAGSKRDFAIHIICGARVQDLVLRMIWHVSAAFVLPVLTCVFVLGLRVTTIYIFLFLVMIALILALIVAVPPLIKISSRDILRSMRKGGS